MTTVLRHSLWFGRLVLAGAAILFTLIALRQIADPIGASTPHQIVLGSSDAITITRVTGGTFLGLALVLVACVVSERRLLTGLGVLATVIVVVTAVRFVGLFLDGPGPFTLQVLKPEVVLATLSSIAFLVERRRRQRTLPASCGGGGVSRRRPADAPARDPHLARLPRRSSLLHEDGAPGPVA